MHQAYPLSVVTGGTGVLCDPIGETPVHGRRQTEQEPGLREPGTWGRRPAQREREEPRVPPAAAIERDRGVPTPHAPLRLTGRARHTTTWCRTPVSRRTLRTAYEHIPCCLCLCLVCLPVQTRKAVTPHTTSVSTRPCVLSLPLRKDPTQIFQVNA